MAIIWILTITVGALDGIHNVANLNANLIVLGCSVLWVNLPITTDSGESPDNNWLDNNLLVSEAEKSDTISTLVLTDFSKAFDVIDHNIAFPIFWAWACRHLLCSGWLTSFLVGNRGSNTKTHFLNGKLYWEGFHKVQSWPQLSSWASSTVHKMETGIQTSTCGNMLMTWPWVKARAMATLVTPKKAWTHCTSGQLTTS